MISLALFLPMHQNSFFLTVSYTELLCLVTFVDIQSGEDEKLTNKNRNPENEDKEDSYISPDSVFRPLDLARYQSNNFSVEINI